MSRLIAGLTVVAALCAPLSAQAAPSQAPAMAYASGRFMEAADLAGQSTRADDRALAARALLAQSILTADPHARAALVTSAEREARAALVADPNSVEARLQLAMAIGIKGRRASIGEALRHGYAGDGKRLIDEAVALSPREPWAWALLGGWHLEVVRRGGRVGARLYGASTQKGLAAFEQARRLAPNDPAIGLHYAAALLGVDAVKYAPQVRDVLAAAAAAPADDAFQSRMQDEARRLGAILATQGPLAAASTAQSRL